MLLILNCSPSLFLVQKELLWKGLLEFRQHPACVWPQLPAPIKRSEVGFQKLYPPKFHHIFTDDSMNVPMYAKIFFQFQTVDCGVGAQFFAKFSKLFVNIAC